MKLLDLTVLYLVIGLGCAVFAWLRPVGSVDKVLDAAMMFVLWPIYGPFLLAPRGSSSTSALAAGARGADWDARLRDARDKVAEIERVLALPEVSESRAQARHEALSAAGDVRAARIVARRLSNIRRLIELRDAAARELEEIREAIARQRVQSEVLRLSTPDGTRALLEELTSQLEGLDQMVELEPEETSGV